MFLVNVEDSLSSLETVLAKIKQIGSSNVKSSGPVNILVIIYSMNRIRLVYMNKRGMIKQTRLDTSNRKG